MPQVVGVIGAGPTGISALSSLIQHPLVDALSGSTVVLVDPSAEVGRGLAFSTPHDEHVLNMRAGTLSLDPTEPGAFTQWLNAYATESSEYPPRRLFGRYLNEQLETIRRQAQQLHISIEHWRTDVVDLVVRDRMLYATGRDGRERTFSTAVLCPGEPKVGSYLHLDGSPQFITGAWDVESIARITPTARIGIMGSGLSAVDAVLQLLAQGHAGEIVCASRRGRFPKVQGPLHKRRPMIVTRDWLTRETDSFTRPLGFKNLVASLRQEVQLAEADHHRGGSPCDPFEMFSQHRRWLHRLVPELEVLNASIAAARRSTPWYYALDSLSDFTPLIWNSLDPWDRMLFLRRFRSMWNEYRHCMPLVNALKLQAAMADGQLSVRRLLQAVEYLPHKEGDWSITADADGVDQTLDDRFDVVIDATGGRHDLAAQADPMLSALIHAGTLVTHPQGGIDVDFHTCRANKPSEPPIYFVGPMTFGVHFYTNSFTTNLMNATSAIDDLFVGITGEARAERLLVG